MNGDEPVRPSLDDWIKLEREHAAMLATQQQHGQRLHEMGKARERMQQSLTHDIETTYRSLDGRMTRVETVITGENGQNGMRKKLEDVVRELQWRGRVASAIAGMLSLVVIAVLTAVLTGEVIIDIRPHDSMPPPAPALPSAGAPAVAP